ncbi:hypothetical protein H9I45_00920 [Polaribacter haliotis]|uniref:Uncharacterized protein n=2 Tax=Polaribacter TaxID=52959 RepID=A0A7L8AGC0_9FLAO|nr:MULTISPECIES: hypothetical protein [Polaribacter]MDD7914088.1 hypothetical protein [Polaribacter sp. MSW5]QOD61032.1 hypothetical protein H9I45_00920 [Polaribacter haliotis]
MNTIIKKELSKDELSDIFFQTLTDYSTLKQKEAELNQNDIEKLSLFLALMDDAKIIFSKKMPDINDFFEWFHHIYVERNYDKNIENWTFIESLENIIKFEIEEIQTSKTINNLNSKTL